MQGFSFCQMAHEPLTSIYSGLSAVHAIIRQKRQNRLQGFTGAFSVDLHHSSARNTAVTQAAYTQPAPRRRTYRQALHQR
jgi:hypothetical protein